MPEEKKTEEQLRQEIIAEYSFEEDDERIDKILEIKKDRYAATQAKKKAREEAEQLKQRKEHYKKLATQTGDKKQEPKGTDAELSIKDSARLQQAGIPVDDWDEVVSYAKFKGVAITDALNSSVVKATLKERQEERQSANAANSGATRRGTSKISGEKLIEEAEKGKFPETDEEIRAMAEARYKKT